MAWTNPKTWSVGETLTAANFNIHIRDNLNALSAHLVGRMTADITRNNSAVFVDATNLALSVAASEVWNVTCYLLTATDVNPDQVFSWTIPAGGAVSFSIFPAPGVGGIQAFLTVSDATSVAADGVSTTTTVLSVIEATIVNGGTAGTYQLRYAQRTAFAANSVLKTNSTLWAVKVA